jgi:hypothetical protein
MARIEEHMNDCKKLLGHPWEQVHKFLDQYAEVFPVVIFAEYHRGFLHNRYGIEVVRAMWGLEAEKAAISRLGWKESGLYCIRRGEKIMFILETGAILVAISICFLCVGYNLKMAGYSRKKMLEGQSFNHQMANRRELAYTLTNVGIFGGIVSAFMFFVILGMLMSVETIETIPEKVAVLSSQNKTLVIADGKAYTMDGIHSHIKRIYFTKGLNSYGWICESNIVIEYKDQWERLKYEE